MANTGNPAGSPKVSNVRITPRADKPKEFRRFEDLTRKLAPVPKLEVDEKRRTT